MYLPLRAKIYLFFLRIQCPNSPRPPPAVQAHGDPAALLAGLRILEIMFVKLI